MPTEIRLAQAGMAMTDGEVTVWHKQAGDRVTRGEVVAEVEVAKTTVEIEAPLTGTLAQIVAGVCTVVGVRKWRRPSWSLMVRTWPPGSDPAASGCRTAAVAGRMDGGVRRAAPGRVRPLAV